ncbi:hypothetical protein [Actinoplanes sp. NPDC049118]|uniref:hypothetical protein n=1 Tax=Actinoplanes sp. NPDC049118 TaxID=3155769 RepID=UPI0033ED461D
MRFGMLKIKTTLDAMLRRFDWTLPPSYEAPWRFTSLPAPADGLPLVLRPSRAHTSPAAPVVSPGHR